MPVSRGGLHILNRLQSASFHRQITLLSLDLTDLGGQGANFIAKLTGLSNLI